MALADEVQAVLNRLSGRGWADLFQKHGLALTAANLGEPLPRIDRSQPGFEDFGVEGTRGIEPGNPALSLIYHAFASPQVHPKPAGERQPEDYPTLLELDTIENYIFSLARKALSAFTNPVIGVFAYQYRAGARSPHRIHADMAYCRTGIARVGTAPYYYDAERRSFWPIPASGSGIAVMPARYGVFIAERRGQTDADAILHGQDSDRVQTFLFPVHKLFPGDECLQGETIRDLSFLELHRNEKLRRIHTEGEIPVIEGFDVNTPPFVRESKDLVGLLQTGTSTLLVPKPSSALVRTATQYNSKTGREEVLHFLVPPAEPPDNPDNRYATSLWIQPADDAAGRAAPEFLNIRTRLEADGSTTNMNDLAESAFRKTLNSGNYKAVHFLDDSCEGAISASLTGLSHDLPSYPAYSVVAAPDFHPLIDQLEIELWKETNRRRDTDHFRQGDPRPLCDGRNFGFTSLPDGRRLPGSTPNPDLRAPGNLSTPAFDRADPANITTTAVVGPEPRSNPQIAKLHRNTATNFLTDAAADVFDPGWELSQFSDDKGFFYQNYGLGSPFPEDGKLCAALNSFWPAVAPDAGRTFPEAGGSTALPLMDRELGYHPDHPMVRGHKSKAGEGWDGEYGPFFAKDDADNVVVNFASMDRSDYTRNAMENRISLSLLANIDAVEMIARMEALRFAIQELPPTPDATVSKTELLLVTAERVEDWSARRDSANKSLTGPGYLYVFAKLKGKARATADLRRRVRPVELTYTCQITDQSLCWKQDDGKFNVVERPSTEPRSGGLPRVRTQAGAW